MKYSHLPVAHRPNVKSSKFSVYFCVITALSILGNLILHMIKQALLFMSKKGNKTNVCISMHGGYWKCGN